MSAQDPEFVSTFLWRHNVVRYLAPFDHAKPAWFHLPGLLLGMLPWTLLLPGLLRFLARHSARTASRRPPALGLFVLAFVWAVLFYSLAGCKRAVYILPALPPLALALGCYLDAVLPWEKVTGLLSRPARAGRRLPTGRLASAATLLVHTGAAASCLVAAQSGLLRPGTGVLLAGVAVVVGVLAWHLSRSLGARAAWVGCGAATFVVLFLGVQLVLPGYARRFSLRGDLRSQATLVADPGVPVVCYPRRWDSVGFYLHRSDVLVFSAEQSDELIALVRVQPATVLVVKSTGALEELRRELPASMEFVAYGRRGTVTVGQVRPRPVAPEGLVARRAARTPRLVGVSPGGAAELRGSNALLKP
jgi:dolichol-phosphate mannosyltransferase